ncbi:cation transporter [Neptunomonas qingdaonensis]|uniref:Cation transporter n=1 Tax=Neptunomonas qingdaonensis TaxID=1045558 RepID=A0A1I2SJY4_9GAMM|nr:cation transporter [Neptunomonas qingdaonensis]SFG53002.1 hypothetical protein SAMN05216175_10845 [Neptunomonas qingdaonensis]
MNDSQHRLGVCEVNLVVRHLRLDKITVANKDLILAEIDAIYGIDNVSFDDKSAVLNIAYDASRCHLDGIEEIIRQHGADVAHDWWTHVKEGYYKYVDQNVKDNAAHEPWSCHKVPPGKK